MENYFIIDASYGEIFIKKFTKEGLIKYLDENLEKENLKILNNLDESKSIERWQKDILIIKGKIIEPFKKYGYDVE